MQLSDIIISRIRKEGPISFCDFMEMCLYYPSLGYYTGAGDKIGTSGDYYTVSTLTPIFAAMIGRQLSEMWQLMGQKDFTVVEYGAGTGNLCRRVLEYLEQNEPAMYDKLHYCIIEKSPAMRAREQEHLCDKVDWHDNIREIAPIHGCVLSNELVDNFPTHIVVMQDELMEVFVDYNEGFKEKLLPAGEEVKAYLDEHKIVLPEGYRTEVNLEATEWIKEVGEQLHEGYVLTIDYGYPAAELYNIQRRRGTLVCYNKHRVSEYPYTDIGKQDITTHVNFSALYRWGLKSGLQLLGYTDQAHFLVGLGIMQHLNNLRNHKQYNLEKEAILKYTLLVDMGRKFKVLVQGKNVPQQKLSGLALA